MLWWKDYRLISHILIVVCVIDLTLAVLCEFFIANFNSSPTPTESVTLLQWEHSQLTRLGMQNTTSVASPQEKPNAVFFRFIVSVRHLSLYLSFLWYRWQSWYLQTPTAVVWHIAILILTILGIRRFALPRSSPLSSTLYHQSLHYAVFTCATCIPMAVRLFHCFVQAHLLLLYIRDTLLTTVPWVHRSSYTSTWTAY